MNLTKLSFTNPLGKVDMTGGGTSHIRIISVSGLEFVPKNYGVIRFSDTDGIETVTENHTERTITGKGDIFFKSYEEVKRLQSVFMEKGEITVTKNGRKFKCGYKPGKFETQREGRYILSFVFQVICDSPFFTAETSESVYLRKRINMVSGTGVTLPAVFTKREQKVSVINKGHKRTEPVIKITYAKPLSGSLNGGIVIKNNTTGKFIKFTGKAKDYTAFDIDIKQRKVLSKDGADISSCLSDDTYLSEFFLNVGVNEIEVINSNLSEDISAKLEFDPLYLGV